MLQLISLISGSSGNASLVTDGKTNLLIDCGTSGKKLEAALKEADVMPECIDALLITHEHSDHIRGAGVMARKYKLPVYATPLTHAAMDVGRMEDSQRCTVKAGSGFEIGTIGIMPFSIPHDAAEPVGYSFFGGNDKVSIATDIGCMNEEIMNGLFGSRSIILESNHDVHMLEIGPYPYPLKKRILSDTGHLSNENASKTALELVKHGTKHIMLGHLSIQNNLPEIAVMETFNRLTGAGVEIDRDVTLQVAERFAVTRFKKL